MAVCLPCVLCFRDGLVCLFRLCLGFLPFLLRFLGPFGLPGLGLVVLGVLTGVCVSFLSSSVLFSSFIRLALLLVLVSVSRRFQSSSSFLLFQLGFLVSGAFRVLAG